jgi:hypothetical protein
MGRSCNVSGKYKNVKQLCWKTSTSSSVVQYAHLRLQYYRLNLTPSFAAPVVVITVKPG